MTELVAAFINEVAEGRMPGEQSPEAIAYHEWSEESALLSGTWAEWTLVRLESESRYFFDYLRRVPCGICDIIGHDDVDCGY